MKKRLALLLVLTLAVSSVSFAATSSRRSGSGGWAVSSRRSGSGGWAVSSRRSGSGGW